MSQRQCPTTTSEDATVPIHAHHLRVKKEARMQMLSRYVDGGNTAEVPRTAARPAEWRVAAVCVEATPASRAPAYACACFPC